MVRPLLWGVSYLLNESVHAKSASVSIDRALSSTYSAVPKTPNAFCRRCCDALHAKKDTRSVGTNITYEGEKEEIHGMCKANKNVPGDIDDDIPAKEPLWCIDYRTPTLSSQDVLYSCAAYAVTRFGLDAELTKKVNVVDVVWDVLDHYVLETFGENRIFETFFKRYEGQDMDNIGGPIPSLWDLEVTLPSEHRYIEKQVYVPGTERIAICKLCEGTGGLPCARCSSGGTNICSICHTRGPQLFGDEPCTICRRSMPSGAFMRRCELCNGKRTNVCTQCGGPGKLISYKVVTASRRLEMGEFLQCRRHAFYVPAAVVGDAKPAIVFSEENATLEPMTGAHSLKVAAASENLLKIHSDRFQLVLNQKHSLRIFPITEVNFEWKGQSSKLLVCGRNKKVFCPNPPHEWDNCRIM